MLPYVVAVVIWVGGMFFAYTILRPVAAASQLEPPARLTLWAGVFAGFFPWVWSAIGDPGDRVVDDFRLVFRNGGLYVHAMLRWVS